MSTKRARDLPAGLEGLRRRFDRWRRTRKVRSRIPEPLWASAVKLVGEYGIHRTAKALRVDYYSLKKRVEGVLSWSIDFCVNARGLLFRRTLARIQSP